MPTQPEFAVALLDPAKRLPSGIVASANRFDVYRNNVVASLSAALARTFPTVEKMVGDAYFRALAAQFVRRHPPRERMVARYGAQFPAFLDRFEPLRDYAYLPDLARLEWSRLEAWHAADHPSTAGRLADEPAALLQRHLVLHPSTRIVVSDWPVVSLWDAHQAQGFVSPEIWEGESLAVFRQRDRLIHAKLSARHAHLLATFDGKASLGDTLIGLGDESAAAEALRVTLNLLRAGCIVPSAPC